MMSARLSEPGAQPQEPPATENTESTMQNAANHSKSPYVLSQRSSDIRWQIFGDRPIRRAKTENKLIFLHIGYSASHHCYLTMQESFTNRSVIDMLNEHFIPIIVDREERPDLDNIYTSYIHSLNSVAGHPLNVFLTPELEPVFGGTYFPGPGSRLVVPETGEEAADFLFILQKVSRSWADEEARVREDGQSTVNELRKVIGEGTMGLDDTSTSIPVLDPIKPTAGEVDLDHLEEAYAHISKTFDRTFGGFVHMPANAPPTFLSGNIDLAQLEEAYAHVKKTAKFITPAKLSFLLKATRFPQIVKDIVGGDLSQFVSNFALQTLRQIVAGGIHDHAGRGFHRCSATRDWSLPAFEKMLSDNALALGVFLDAWLLTATSNDGALSKNAEFADTVFELADYLTSSPILVRGGGFATSEAADSYTKRGDAVLRNGAYYLWTKKEFETVIGDEQESSVAAVYWKIKEDGNVEKDQDPNDEYLNQNVLRVAKTTAELSLQFKIPETDVVKLVKSAQGKLKAHRQRERPHPAVDTKIVTAYNGMAIAALARTAAACVCINDMRGAGYLYAATKAAMYIKHELWDVKSRTLYRTCCEGGRAETKAFAEDYAFLIDGVLELYEATADEDWLEWADDLQSTQIMKFYDHPEKPGIGTNARSGAFYCTTQDAPHILLRIKDAMDTSQPSTNAVSVSNLFRLGALLDDARYTHLAKETINAFEAEMLQYPYLFPGLLSSVVASKLGVSRWTSVKADGTRLTDYHLKPRRRLGTLLHHKPSNTLLMNRSPELAERLDKIAQPGIYSLNAEGQIEKMIRKHITA
ncbi:hypothetical protein BJ170DRAFT_159606 [Xylariales sp. AK1849]|nr:hypothetical protein BJ170DRAFT_159606 [Xylariales sp. AK1849]